MKTSSLRGALATKQSRAVDFDGLLRFARNDDGLSFDFSHSLMYKSTHCLRLGLSSYTSPWHTRLEKASDYAAVECLMLAAFKTFTFSDGSKPTHTDEHYLAHIMRDAAAFVPELDFVGEVDGEIVANIMYTKSKIIRPSGSEVETLTFGPVSVKPELHGKGLGAEIICHSIDCTRKLGYGAVIIVGHPQYYPRFGFKPASDYSLTMPDSSTMEPFMALKIQDGYFGADGGKWYEDDVYKIDQEAFNEWNTEFPQQ